MKTQNFHVSVLRAYVIDGIIISYNKTNSIKPIQDNV